MKVGAFGDFAFQASDQEVRTWQDWAENHSDRWQTMNIVGDQALWYGGRNLADVNIRVVLNPKRTNVEAALALLESLRGKAHALVLAGKPLTSNKFVLLSFPIRRLPTGWVKVSLNLKEYK